MTVDPATPCVEVAGPTLFGDGLERPNLHPVVEQDASPFDFRGIEIGILQSRLDPALAVLVPPTM